ncbi:hypothetical protein LBMAG53_35350 [Planctomycetota bacterium]|nr:hypothetical protein LBMAG53_35350 [Planctomycetota bacterium]
MLRSIKHLYGDRLIASDGELGFVKDFYFDDRNWVIRYLVADTGSWLSERLVLIPPHALGIVERAGQRLQVHLTRRQIEDSPSIDHHKPVSRQYEESYYQHYGLPFYWQGDSLWGITGFPPRNLAVPPQKRNLSDVALGYAAGPDAHLRSTVAVHGYQAHGKHSRVGQVTDFVIDDQSWAIRYLVVRTNPAQADSEVLVPIAKVSGVSYAESSVRVTCTAEEIRQSPDYHCRPDGSCLDPVQTTAKDLTPSTPEPRVAESKHQTSNAPVGITAAAQVRKLPEVSSDEVATSAYFTFVRQGRQGGHDVQHWLDAEAKLRALAASPPAARSEAIDQRSAR